MVAAMLSGCTGDDSEGKTDSDKPVQGEPAGTDFCSAASTLFGLLDEGRPAATREFYERLAASEEVLAADVPDGLKSQLTVFLDGMRAVQPALEAVDYDSAELDTSGVQGFEDGSVPAAGARIQAYVDQSCRSDGAPLPDDVPSGASEDGGDSDAGEPSEPETSEPAHSSD